MILLATDLKQEIMDHAEAEYPHECGGMLLGSFLSEGSRSVGELYKLENARQDSRHNRILLLPQDVMRAEKYARELGLDVIGYYHSHPNAPAVPSQYDLEHALPVWSYMIASVIDGKAVDVRSWQMQNDRSKFDEEIIGSQVEDE